MSTRRRNRLLLPAAAGGLALCCLCAALGAVLSPGETPAPPAQVVVRLLATPTAPATFTTTPAATPPPTAEPLPTATPETPPVTAPAAVAPAPASASAGDPAGYACLAGLTWEEARPVNVVDGDTLDVVMPDGRAERVRLIGIDTPERGEPGYREATQAHAALLSAPLRLARDVNDRDRYGRLLRYALAADGRSVSHELIRQGWARTLTIPPDVRCADELVALQREAQAAGRALWAQAGAAPPPTIAPAGNCDPAYPDVCIAPPPPDLNCRDIPYRRFRVLPPDPHRFDADGNGIGCERN